MEFKSRKDLDSHVMKKDYPGSSLCFALAWDEYDRSNTDEPVYALEILTKLEQSLMANPNYPQDKYYTMLNNKFLLHALNGTDFLQIMATTTKLIVDENTSSDAGDFSIMYTQMNTDKYLQTMPFDISGPVVAIIFEVFTMISAVFLNVGTEADDKENMIQTILKRLGVQKSVLVTRDLIFISIYSTFCTVVFTFILWITAY